MVYHRRSLDKLRVDVVTAVLEAERQAVDADIAAEHGIVSYEYAHHVRMILRGLEAVEERVRHTQDIVAASESYDFYSDATFQEVSR